MISCCVFSKNRPLQLDAFLRSVYKNAPYVSQLRVLYTADNQDFYNGYNILIREYPNVEFIKEDNIYEQIIDIVRTSNEYFMWSTDDSLFFKKEELTQDDINWVFKQEQVLALNLRMGLNIKWQNHWKSDRSEPINVINKRNNIVIWDANKYDVNTDVGRVWQNDASIMPRDMYLDRLLKEDGWKVNKSRSLDGLANCGRIFSPCYMAAFEHSVYLNVPVNLVHLLDDGRLFADNWGKFVKFSVYELQNAFNQGYRINWEEADLHDLDCGRREIEYAFIKHNFKGDK